MSNSDKISEKEYKKLKESEEKFRKISSNAQDAIIQIDDHGVISYWNKAAEKIFGYSENEVLGKNLHILIAPKRYHKSLLKGMELFRKTGKGAVIGKTLEIEGIKKNGTEFPVELSISSVKVNENWNALAFIRDITERKQAEEKYIAIFEHSPIAIELYDSDGILIKANKACLDLFGIVDFKDLEEFKLFDDLNIPEKEKDLLKDGKTIRYEGEFDFDKVKQLNLYKTTKSGVIYLDVVITPLYIRDKQEISNFLVQIQDITERKLTEQKLKEYSRNLEDIVEKRMEDIQKEMEKAKMYLDISAAIILVLNSDGLVELINKKGCEILGYDEEQIIGKNCFDNFIPKENKEEIRSLFRKLIAGEMEPVECYENLILTREGKEKLIAWHNNVLKDEQGNIIGILSSGEDITERKEKEEEAQLHSEIMTNMSEGVYLIRLEDLIIVYANPRFEEMFGYDPGEMIGKYVVTVNAPTDKTPEETKNEIVGILKDTGEWHGEVLNVKKDGTPFWCYANVSLFDHHKYGKVIVSVHTDITERRKMMEELRIKDIVFNASLSAQSTADINGIIDHVNPAFLELWGYKLNEEAIGNSVGSFFANPDDAVPVFKALTETGKWEGEFLAKRFDGSTFISQGFASAIYNENGDQIGFQSANLDITKHREADKKLEESEKNYRTLIENAQEGIWTIDENSITSFVNPRMAEMLGYAQDEMLGKHLFDFMDEKAVVIANRNLERRKQGIEEQHDFEFLRKNGTRIYTILETSPLMDEEGNYKGAVAFVSDITKRKKAEMELQLERDNLINILNSMEDGVYIVDQNYDIEYVNPSLTKEFGQYEGKKCYKYLHNRQDVCPWCKAQKGFEGKTVRLEWYSFKNQKTYDRINMPLKNVDGSISTLEIFRDITEFKKVEQDLLSTLENLKSVNIELERFAYVASHDLQEPLRMIVSFIQLLEKRYKDKLDEDADDFIAFIVDGAKRMQLLISDLLIFSRIGRSDKPFKLIDINVVIDSVINNLKKLIEETNATITHDPLPTIVANEGEFIQLLQNLISNAIKFHKAEEPPVVHISAKLQKNQWIFSVRDNGIGLDSQYFDRIFIIFQRLHKKGEFGGTGIGLAICKKIIERHSGKIWVESELGKGSTFYFSIPKTEVRK